MTKLSREKGEVVGFVLLSVILFMLFAFSIVFAIIRLYCRF